MAYCASVRAQLPMGLRQVHDALFGLAISCARLNLRTVVLPHPDVTTAVCLMEETLLNRWVLHCVRSLARAAEHQLVCVYCKPAGKCVHCCFTGTAHHAWI